ncbi:MAG TPA: DNA polymerase [Candidatus Paceibacterota bacterium]|nr:DNA polymerase [Candidatus Paceibacterota bacterium]
MAKGTKRLVILDTHAILHRAYHALPDFASSKGEPTGALYGLISMLVRIAGELEPDYIAAAFDLPKPTHRHIAYEKYKSHRPKTDDALVSQIIASREVLAAFGVALYEKEGFEADDIIGTIVEKMKRKKDLDIIIASGDMDTMQLIDDDRVRVFTLKMGLTDTVLYDEEGVKKRYGFGPELIPDFKGLRGDPSDNIPGIKGVGEKTATILISQFGTVENIYHELEKHPDWFENAGIKGSMLEKIKAGKEDAEFSKTLAIIRRDAPIDFSLPPKEWRESINPKEVEDILSRYEFRSLVPRVRSLVESISEDNVTDAAIPGDELFAESAEDIAPDELAKMALAVSVLDSNIARPTLEDIYRAGRSRTFEEARKNILAEIAKNNLSFVYENIELPLMPVLRAMEKKGVCIDKKFLAKLSKDYHAELDKIAARIYEAAGEEFNINSPKQLGDILFDKLGLTPARQKKTASGARSTRESELEKMRDLHPIVADILSYRELAKLLGTYIDNLPTLLDEHNRVHTTFIQIGAATGRIATQNPGLQNIPIKTELGRAIREAFIAEKGYSMVSFDYSQIELRIAAWLSGDPGLSEIFKAGRDVHAEVAARVFHVRMEDVSYEQRRRAKVINFGILYGMGVTSLQQSLGTTRAEAQEFYNQYFAAFPRLAAYLDEAKAFASTNGYISTYFGRRRYLDGIKSPIPYIRAAAERMAINAPMQGTQADIVKLAMVRIVDYLKAQNFHDGAHMLLQVHDELVFEVADDKVAALAPKIKEIMENVVPESERRGIPFLAEGKVGKNWGQMEKLKL